MNRKLLATCLILLLASPAFGVQNFLLSDFSKSTTAAQFLTELDTNITVTTTAESWFALADLTASNTTSYPATITMQIWIDGVLSESATVTFQVGLGRYQLPKQYQGSDLGVGPHTFRVKVNQSTNSPIIYQTESYLGLFNNTGTGGVVSGGGDVVGPASSVDDRIATFDGTTGKLLQDNGTWTIASANMLATNGRIGINDATPDAAIDVIGSPSVPAAILEVAGATTSNSSTITINNTVTSSTASNFNIDQTILSNGVNNGTGAQNIGSYYDVAGGTTNQAIFAAQGDLVMVNGKIAVGGDVTPDALIDVDVVPANGTGLSVLATGAAVGAYAAVGVTNHVTGGASGQNNFGQAITVDGAYAGSNVGLFLNVSGAAEFNAAVVAFAGDILAVQGDLSTLDGTMGATQSDQTASAMSASCPSRNGNGTSCLSVAVNGDGAAGARNAVEVDVETGTGAAAEALGIGIDVDGTGGLKAQGMSINAHGAVGDLANEALAIDGGDFTFGSGGPGLRLSWANKHALFNHTSPTFFTDAAIEVYSDEDETAINSTCTSTGGGDDCVSITSTNTGTGTVGGLFVSAVDDGTSGTAIGATLSATGAPAGFNYALNVIAGDAVFGAIGTLEDLHWNQPDSQIIINKDNGIAVAAGASAVEITQTPTKIGLQVYGSSTGVALETDFTGAVTAASTANILSNTQTSSTASINKTGVEVISTGAWTGTGGVKNAAVLGSATGATDAGSNYAFWALQGGVRGPWFQYDPLDDPPFTCDADHKGATAFDNPAGILCNCSDSDGASFEWEAVGLPLVTCTF